MGLFVKVEGRILFVENIKAEEHMLMFKNSLRLIQNIKLKKKKPNKKPASPFCSQKQTLRSVLLGTLSLPAAALVGQPSREDEERRNMHRSHKTICAGGGLASPPALRSEAAPSAPISTQKALCLLVCAAGLA